MTGTYDDLGRVQTSNLGDRELALTEKLAQELAEKYPVDSEGLGAVLAAISLTYNEVAQRWPGMPALEQRKPRTVGDKLMVAQGALFASKYPQVVAALRAHVESPDNRAVIYATENGKGAGNAVDVEVALRFMELYIRAVELAAVRAAQQPAPLINL